LETTKFAQLISTIVLSAALLVLGGCKSDKAAKAVDSLPATTAVVVQPVTQVTTSTLIAVSGALEADKTATLGFLVPGRVHQVLVEEGGKVTKGMLLATIEPQDYQNRLDMAEAAVLRAKDAYQRYEPLYKQGAFAQKNLIELKANLAEATAAGNVARKALKDTSLYAPISGIIGSKSIEIGQMVSAQSPAFTVVKTDLIYARVAVPETEIDQVSLGKSAQVSFSALQGRSFTGRVSMIGAVADERTRTYPVKIELANPELLLRPGMIVQAEIQGDRPLQLLTVPGVAIVRDADNLPYVFVADSASKTAHRRRVVPGGAHGEGIAIRSGLNPEDVVIISGQHKLSDGAPITTGSATGEAKP